ncbi:MAG: Ig-like domain-containing protein, partial [Gemmatimonadetes bacterium]|nr:Ig-like domain-containing protein [Gemmatimonadota bacterium]
MHPMRVWFTISIAAAAVLTSCTEGTVAPPDAGALETTPVSVRITADAGLSLLVGQSRALGARVSSAAGTSMPGAVVEWRSTNPQVAAVNAEGIVAALAPGRTLVIASLPPADLADTVAVDVAPIPVAAVSVTPAETSLPVGEALVFTVQATGPLGESLTGRTVAWSSSAPEVVTVDDGGSATLEAPGTATITAEVEGVRGSAIVTVEDTTTVVGAISLTPAVAQIVAGETVGFAAEALDLTGGAIPGMPMTWSSAAPGIASVDATGTVTGLLPGTTEIRARAGGVTGTAQITVTPPPPPTVASVSVTPASAVVPMGSARAFSAEARAADGTVLTG